MDPDATLPDRARRIPSVSRRPAVRIFRHPYEFSEIRTNKTDAISAAPALSARRSERPPPGRPLGAWTGRSAYDPGAPRAGRRLRVRTRRTLSKFRRPHTEIRPEFLANLRPPRAEPPPPRAEPPLRARAGRSGNGLPAPSPEAPPLHTRHRFRARTGRTGEKTAGPYKNLGAQKRNSAPNLLKCQFAASWGHPAEIFAGSWGHPRCSMMGPPARGAWPENFAGSWGRVRRHFCRVMGPARGVAIGD